GIRDRNVTGVQTCALPILFKQVSIGEIKATPEKEVKENTDKTGNRIFLPVMTLAISSLVIAQIFPALSQSVLGIGALIGTVTLRSEERRVGKEGSYRRTT